MTDTHEVTALLERMTAAWNAGDATAYAAQFTEDADYITWFGLHTESRAAIEAGHRHLFQGPLKGSTLPGAEDGTRKIRFLSPDVALIVSTGGLSTTGVDAPDDDRHSVLTLTAVRHPDGWRLSSFQNTRKQHVGPPA
jgi:uncharacterized protein (TIGR02246 family)